MSLDLKVFSKNEIYPLKDHLLIILNNQIIIIYNNTITLQDINYIIIKTKLNHINWYFTLKIQHAFYHINWYFTFVLFL